MDGVYKAYVRVVAEFTPEGKLIPMWIVWDDGRKFEIDHVKRCQRAASLKAGGAGIRYTCIISGRECYLYYEENYKWFVEAKAHNGGEC